MNWKHLTLLALAIAGCTGTKDDDDDDTGGFGGTDFNEPSACTTSLDIYEAYAFAPSVVRLAFRLFCIRSLETPSSSSSFALLLILLLLLLTSFLLLLRIASFATIA